MRWLYRRFWLPLYRRWALRHIRSERTFRYGDLHLQVPPGVFHPGIFFSTPVFLEFLGAVDFAGKKTLDIGTGSGALALYSASRGARAAALDINPAALETARQNAAANRLPLELWCSDLFDAVPEQTFDYFLINPPFYPREPQNAAEHAFFAGEDLGYFEKLFRQLPNYAQPYSRIWMILSEDCDLEKIQEIAARTGFRFTLAALRRKWGERLMVFEINTPQP